MTDDPDLQWRQTWPEVDEDYVLMIDGHYIGRVYPGGTIHSGPVWRYFGIVDGQAPSRREAMLAIEDAYLGSRARKSSDDQTP